MMLKQDYDNMTIYEVARIHAGLKPILRIMGWKVRVIGVWTSSGKKGKHVLMDLKTDVPENPWTIIMFEQVFRSDNVRSVWEMSRVLSAGKLNEWTDQDHWDILWEDHIEDKRGLKLLRRLWK